MVFLVHADPDMLCVVTQELPGQNAGTLGCDSGPYVIARGMFGTWGSADPASDTTAVLVPDRYTATITKGTFLIAGQGVILAQGDGVDVTLTNNAGHTLHVSSPPRPAR